MSDLKQDLMQIKGVGEATAESILETLETHDTSDPLLNSAIKAAENRDDRQAAIFLRRYSRE